MIRRKVGSLSGRSEPGIDEGALFCQSFLGLRSRAGPGRDKSFKAAKLELFGLARHLS